MDNIRKVNSALGATVKMVNHDISNEELDEIMNINCIECLSSEMAIIAAIDAKMTVGDYITLSVDGKLEKKIKSLTDRYSWEEIEAKATKALEKLNKS